MSRDPQNPRDLIDAWAAGDLNDVDGAALDHWLAGNPKHGVEFLRSMMLHRHLADLAETYASPIATPNAATKPTPGEASGPRPTPFIIYPIAIAASLLFTAAIVGVYLFAFNTDPQPDPIQPNQPGPAVATLIESTGDLRTPHGYPAEGEDYSAGEYTLDSGTAEFMLTNAVNVKLRGDSRMHMRNNMNVSLTRGSAEFLCPSDATGFTVRLPGGLRVVDLGTRFRIELSGEGAADIKVLDGRVRIERDGIAPVEVGSGQRAHASLDPAQPINVRDDALPIAAYDFDDPANRLFDVSENANDAQSTSVEYVFDEERGSDVAEFTYRKRIRVPVGAERGFTFAAWIKSNAGHYLVDTRARADGEPVDAFVLGIGFNSANTIGFWDRGSLWHFDNAGADITDGQWHHVAWTYDPDGSVRMYIDGELALRAKVTPEMELPADFVVGLFVQPKKVGEIFTARIDDVRLYDTPLSAEQIESLVRQTETQSSTTSASEPADRSRRHQASDVPRSEK